ncbi:MAG: hypothetical protein HUU01_19670 [Saprospiraceae bacterium]|nr:hypothetical protein [Saprospiraceae bacterium]
MKRITFPGVLALFVCHCTFAQNDRIDFDLLTAPATPAATLLGFAPSEIDKPRDVAEFMASVVSQTDGFSNLPANYAIEFAPAWLFGKEKISFESFQNNKLANCIWQSLVISAAVRRREASEANDLPLTQVSAGIKVSLSRGHFPRATLDLIDSTRESLSFIHRNIESYLADDLVYQAMIDSAFESQSWLDTLNVYRNRKFKDFKSAELAKLESKIKRLRFNRIGFKLDLTAGIVQDYANNSYNQRSISKLGIWLTSGWEGENGLSVLAMGRVLKSPDADYQDENGNIQVAGILSYDAGVRLLWAPSDKPYSLSGEALYRKVSSPKELPASWRYTVNFEYKLKSNLGLNFTYGRDFDDVVIKEGNVVALLSFITLLGTSKPTGM